MAIAFHAALDLGNNGGTTSSYTKSYTAGSGTNRCLIVGVVGNNTTDLLTGVTYAGVAMTLIGSHAPGQRWTYLFYLLNPASGANNIVISASGNGFLLGAASDYTGVKQSGQPDASIVQNVAAVNPVTTTLTTIADNCWTVLFGNSAWASISAGAGDVLRAKDAAFLIYALLDSNSAITPPAAYAMGIAGGASSTINTIMASLAPDTGAAGPLFRPPPMTGLGTGGPFFSNPIG